MIVRLLLGISRPCYSCRCAERVVSDSCDSLTPWQYDMMYEILDVKYSTLRDFLKILSGKLAEIPTKPSVVHLDLFSDFLEDQ